MRERKERRFGWGGCHALRGGQAPGTEQGGILQDDGTGPDAAKEGDGRCGTRRPTPWYRLSGSMSLPTVLE